MLQFRSYTLNPKPKTALFEEHKPLDTLQLEGLDLSHPYLAAARAELDALTMDLLVNHS